MRYDEILKLIADSTDEHWHKITAWGGGGPSFLYGLPVGDEEADAHEEIAVYQPDVSIGMAWGIKHLDDFKEDWANGFSDPKAYSEFVDIFYNGMLVHRELRVVVDGGRCGLPVPEMDGDKLYVDHWKYNLMRVVHEMGSASYDYDEYLRRAGIELR